LPPGGLVVSLEVNDHHATVARHSIGRAVPGVKVEVRVGPAAVTIRDGLVTEAAPAEANAVAARAFNAAIAAHPRLESMIVPIVRHTIDGMSISIVK
jgi:predicted O-methyltransferase YrrM